MRNFVGMAAAATVMLSLVGGGIALADELTPYYADGVPKTTPDISTKTPGKAKGDATASAALAADCRLFTWGVGQSGTGLGVKGGRFGCGDWGSIGVQMYKVRNLYPDWKLAEKQAAGVGDIAAIAYSSCQGAGTYYGNTWSATGNSLEGEYRYLCG